MNTTESAVRVTHLPTGITASIQVTAVRQSVAMMSRCFRLLFFAWPMDTASVVASVVGFRFYRGLGAALSLSSLVGSREISRSRTHSEVRKRGIIILIIGHYEVLYTLQVVPGRSNYFEV